MEKTVITFNDLPEVVAQLRDEVMSLRSLLTEQRSVNNAKAVDTHVPMFVDEAAEYLGIPKGTLYMKSCDASSMVRLAVFMLITPIFSGIPFCIWAALVRSPWIMLI